MGKFIATSAFVPVWVRENRYAIAIVVRGVPGYAICPEEPTFELPEARKRVVTKNNEIGIAPADCWDVLDSSIKASRNNNTNWSRRGEIS